MGVRWYDTARVRVRVRDDDGGGGQTTTRLRPRMCRVVVLRHYSSHEARSSSMIWACGLK